MRAKRLPCWPLAVWVKTAEQVRRRLWEHGIRATLVNMRFVKPFDRQLLKKLAASHSRFVTLEENVITGGFGQQVASWAGKELPGVSVMTVAIPDQFVTHGNVDICTGNWEWMSSR